MSLVLQSAVPLTYQFDTRPNRFTVRDHTSVCIHGCSVVVLLRKEEASRSPISGNPGATPESAATSVDSDVKANTNGDGDGDGQEDDPAVVHLPFYQRHA
ncbi:hypothetical protein GW17_00003126 [Ensete ventricosum]|nr:hypothetical protein GW17_00003126 [Ensete ventricosum]